MGAQPRHGFQRDYGTNPYPGYDDIHSSPFLFSGKTDGRLGAMSRIVGIDRDGQAVAVVVDRLRRRRMVTFTVGTRPVVAWLVPGASSALAGAAVAGGPDIGATGVFDPVLDGRVLHFEPVTGGFRDQETATIWDVLGRGVAGPLAGRRLSPIIHVDTFWFAWAAFRPATRIINN